MKKLVAFTLILTAILAGCRTTAPYGTPIRTIDNPMQPGEYENMVEQYGTKGELWRGDPMAVTQIEIYKIEGKSAVLLDQKLVDQEDEGTKRIIEVITRRNIYWFHLEKPNYTSSVWWINKVEVFALPSQRPEDNPALKNSPSPVLREPKSLSPVQSHESESRAPDAP